MNGKYARTRRTLVAILGAMLIASPFAAQAFERGASSATIMVGAGRQLDRDYTIISGRFGYYFVREFEASAAFEAWRGNDPGIYKIIPELRYVYTASRPFKPYLAVFVSRTIYQGGVPDRNTYGGKAGLYYTLNPNAHFGIGFIHERIESCNEAIYRNCRQTYPEASMHFTF